MTHELYKQTLLGGEVVRLLNTRIASSNHRLHTIVVNKKSLSGYDDKRFTMNDQVSMLPYGHRSIREDMFFKSIMIEPNWGADDLGESEQESGQQAHESGQHAQESGQHAQESGQRAPESGQHAQESGQRARESGQRAPESGQHAQESGQRARESGQRAPESGQRAQESGQRARESGQQVKSKYQQKHKRQTQQSANVRQTKSILNTSINSIPDPGFHQRNYSEDELNENVVDFDNLSEFSDSGSSTDAACDGFILSQAIEDSDSSPQPPITIDQQPPTNLPVTIDRQNLQDQPPTKKRRRARIIESDSEED